MAAKKRAAAAPVDVPAVLLEDDGNASIKRAKTALAKKWSLVRAESLAGIAQLGWFLVALRREAEARELAELVASGLTFDGNQSLWSHAASPIALAARLARQANDEPRRAALVAKLVANPGMPTMPRDEFLKHLALATRDIRSAEVEPSQKYACEGFARGCARATYFTETAAEGAYEAGTIDVAALEGTIEEGLAGLRVYLAR